MTHMQIAEVSVVVIVVVGFFVIRWEWKKKNKVADQCKAAQPKSMTAREIYKSLLDDLKRKDAHSSDEVRNEDEKPVQ